MSDQITIVGVGSLGSHVALFLRHYNLKVIDFDKIESKNVATQFHVKQGIGKNKTQSLQQVMQMFFGVKINIIQHKVVENNVKEILNGSSLVIDCLDNAVSRNLIQTYVRANNIPCLHGALSADGQMGRIVWDADFAVDSEAVVGQATCDGGAHLPFIGQVAATIARAAQEFLDNGKKISYNAYPLSGIKSF